MKPVRTALIGCGKVGKIHAAALHSLPESEFVAVCDADIKRAESYAAQFGGRPFADVAQLLREVSPEAVVIATPHPLHANPATQAMERGAHVLIEKPLAASLK